MGLERSGRTRCGVDSVRYEDRERHSSWATRPQLGVIFILKHLAPFRIPILRNIVITVRELRLCHCARYCAKWPFHHICFVTATESVVLGTNYTKTARSWYYGSEATDISGASSNRGTDANRKTRLLAALVKALDGAGTDPNDIMVFFGEIDRASSSFGGGQFAPPVASV